MADGGAAQLGLPGVGGSSRHGGVVELRAAAVRMAVQYAAAGTLGPPDTIGARLAGGPEATRYIEAVDAARAGASRIGAALDGIVPTLLEVETEAGPQLIPWDPFAAHGTERISVCNVAMKDGARLAIAGRGLRADWLANPDKTAANVGGCSCAWGVLRRPDGGVVAHPMSCTSGLCPICSRNKAAETVRRWTDPVMALAKEGCTLVHVTLTQPQFPEMDDDETPVYLTPWEKEHGKYLVRSELRPLPWEGGGNETTFAPVPGEPLLDNRSRLYNAWRALRNETANRAQWRRNVFASIHGIESTGRVWDPRREGNRLRWHSHLHALVILYPGVDPAEWFADLCERWAEETRTASGLLFGASISPVKVTDQTTERGAQCMRVMDSGDTEELRRSLVETLKYPVKLGELTDAQLVEFLAACKGSKNHWATAAFHASDKRGKRARQIRDGVTEDDVHEDGEPVLVQVPIRDIALCSALGIALQSDQEGPSEVLYEATTRDNASAVLAPDGSAWRVLTVRALAAHVEAAEVPVRIRGVTRAEDPDAPLGAPERRPQWSPVADVDPAHLLAELTAWTAIPSG